MEKDNHVFDNGEIVFVNSTYHIAEKCEVLYVGTYESDGKQYHKYYLRSIDCSGNFWASEGDVYQEKQKALKASSEKYADLVRAYCDEIKDINDLIRFPLKHCFCGEEYTEYEAREAYCIKAKELAGIEGLS